ncbi:MAG: hypothetical protein MUO54_02025, partial [Anaerolineales bacterium]|nr:hypothetical protein [Anaerolineales bacterium]
MNLTYKTRKIFFSIIILMLGILPVRGSEVDPSLQLEKIRAHSRTYEFDYVSWTVSALLRKLTQASLDVFRYIPREEGSKIVLNYLDLGNRINHTQENLIRV